MNSDIFKDVLIVKPWGSEYMLYSTPQIELWHLHINKDEKTSFHCHPNKKTGLVVLQGSARVDFINDSIELNRLDKVMMRPGLFHSTTALYDGLNLLEIETPPNKNDLIRMDDSYGRKNLPYESPANYEKDLNNIRFTEHNTVYDIDGCNMYVTKPDDNFKARYCDLIMVLGGSISGPMGGQLFPVLSAGDVVSSKTFNLLREKFPSIDLEILVLY